MKHEAHAQWVQQQFNLPKTPDHIIIVKILKDKEKYHTVGPQDQSLKRSCFLSHSELDNTLTNWVLQMEYQKIRINGDLIKEKSRQFAQTLSIRNPSSFSNGWLQAFNHHHSFHEHRIHGESEDAQMSSNIEGLIAVIKGKDCSVWISGCL